MHPTTKYFSFIFCFIYLILCKSSFAQEVCSLSEVIRKGITINDVFAFQEDPSILAAIPSPFQRVHLESLFERAPIKAVGKITYRNDESEEALCSGALISSDVIVTTWDCINPQGKYGEFFWPGSSPDNLSPLGSAKIINYYYDALTKVAFAKLDRSLIFDNFNILFIHKQFPASWKWGGYWNLLGYWNSSRLTPRLESGCAVTSATSRGGIFSSEKYLKIDARDTKNQMTDGTILFSNLCGKWTIIGIKVDALRGKIVHIDRTYTTAKRALEAWGYGLVDAKDCQTPQSGTLKAIF